MGFFQFSNSLGTNSYKNTYNTNFDRYIFSLFKDLSAIHMLVILVELWYEMFWNFFINQTLYRELSYNISKNWADY